jgi:hypothetical protein
MMPTYFVTLGKGLRGPTHMNGALCLGDKALYFVCSGLGRLGNVSMKDFGPTGLALEEFRKTGAPSEIDEGELARLASSTPNSFVLTPDKIALLSRSMWSGSKIVCSGGEKIVAWNPGFGGSLRTTLRDWANRNGVKTKGL